MSYILVVDDDARVAGSTAELLRSLLDPPAEVLTAHTYDAACRALARPGLEALLTDHDLGGGPTGTHVVRLARGLHPTASLVVMSGELGPIAEGAYGAGADAFLPKPFRPAELASALLAKRPARTEQTVRQTVPPE